MARCRVDRQCQWCFPTAPHSSRATTRPRRAAGISRLPRSRTAGRRAAERSRSPSRHAVQARDPGSASRAQSRPGCRRQRIQCRRSKYARAKTTRRPGGRGTKPGLDSLKALASFPVWTGLDSNLHWRLRGYRTLRHVRRVDYARLVARRAIVRQAALSCPTCGVASITSVRRVRAPARGRTVGCRMLRRSGVS